MPRTHTPSPDPRRLYGGGRVTPARRAIADAVAGIGAAFTVDVLHGAVARRRPDIGVATVYRAVGALAAAGSIAPVGSRGGCTLYALCAGGAHHHHLVCTGCGAVVGVACPVGPALLGSAQAEGYTVTAHEVTLYGLCAACAGKRG